MVESDQNPLQTKKRSGHWRWIAGIALLCLVAIAVLGIVVYRAEPTLRAMVIETLSTRFKSRVELDAFHVSLMQGLQVSGAGLRIFGERDANNHEPGLQPIVFQPIINVAEFRFHMGIRDLFRTPMHVDTVYVIRSCIQSEHRSGSFPQSANVARSPCNGSRGPPQRLSRRVLSVPQPRTSARG